MTWSSTSRHIAEAFLARDGWPVFFEFFDTAGLFLTAAAGAESTFVHLATGSEITDARVLRRAERARVEAVAAADAQILGMKHHAFFRREDAAHRADRGAGRVGAV